VSSPTIPRPLARRIDKLARRAHAFHRYAHHPLCEPYRGEVIRLGRRLRICKGCTYLAAGLGCGILAGVACQPSLAWGCTALVLAVATGAASLQVRLPKLFGRAGPGAGVGLALCSGWYCGLAAATVIGLFGLLYRRRGSDRKRCETCPERQQQPCSGFVRIVRRERAFQRKADGWLRHTRS
jgi:hypothetical protein